MVKKIIKMIKKESGQALLLTLVLLGVGSIILMPMLSYMGSSLDVGTVYEFKERTIYAADAGVQDAIWRIQNGGGGLVDVMAPGIPFPVDGLPPYIEANPSDPENPYQSNIGIYTIYDINGNSISIEIEHHAETGGIAYEITSTATDANANSNEIEAWITTVYGDYTGITNHVVTSQGDYDIDNGVEYPDGDYDPDTNPNGAISNYDGPWPTPIELINYYSMFVNKTNPYEYDELNLDDTDTHDEDFITVEGDVIKIGAAYIEGNFNIYSSNKNVIKTLKLEGNLYITGKTEFGGNREWILDLNGHSIFVESNLVSGAGPALLIDSGNNSGVILRGSGCIVAIGDIIFAPHMDAGTDDYVLVLSAIGETWMHPNGAFYGTLAGSVFVDVQSGSEPHIEWNDPDQDGDGIPDIDFPGGSTATVLWGILSWKIS